MFVCVFICVYVSVCVYMCVCECVCSLPPSRQLVSDIHLSCAAYLSQFAGNDAPITTCTAILVIS